MRVSYDFHIHTAGSPCAEEEMPPHNIIQLAKLLGKQIIAITDHNTCMNCEAVRCVGETEGIIVIPGMEIECMEEFHMIALFPTLEGAQHIQEVVYAGLPTIKNRKGIFGEQPILNASSECVGENERFLLTATQVSAMELVEQIKTVEGIAIPAHIDRTSYSILSNLGGIPEELGFSMLEVSTEADMKAYQMCYPNYRIIRGTDAHRLEMFCACEQFIELDILSVQGLFEKFKIDRI